jgi:hypothetical protein
VEIMSNDENVQIHDDESHPRAKIILACPHSLKNPKFIELLTKIGWNSILCLSTGDINVLSCFRDAEKIYFVVSECILSSPFVDMVLKVIPMTDNSSCQRFLLRLDDTEIPPILSELMKFPEDDRLAP